MKVYRISRSAYDTPLAAFSGVGASRADHRWTWGRATMRAVYCSDSLALACLECLVHIRPLPRKFPESVYYTVDVPEAHIEELESGKLPDGWDDDVAGAQTREIGTAFIRERRAVALIVPTAILPQGLNAIINPVHPEFRLEWVSGPFVFPYNGRLE